MCEISDCIMMGFLMFCAWCDWKHRSISVTTLALYSLAAVLLAVFVKRQSVSEISVGVLFGIIFLGISAVTKEAIGYGDSWLIAILGSYLGLESVLWVLLTASVCACIVSLIQLCRKQWNRGYTLPFVPFLAVGFAGVFFA